MVTRGMRRLTHTIEDKMPIEKLVEIENELLDEIEKLNSKLYIAQNELENVRAELFLKKG